MAFIDARENDILDDFFRDVSNSWPATRYLALFTACSSNGSSVTEVSGGAYARQLLNASDFSAASGGAITNTAAKTFPEATASWGTVKAWGVYDAVTAGSLWFWGKLSTARTIDSGDTPRFVAGDLDASITSETDPA